MKKRCERIVVVFINQRPLQKVTTMWSSRNKMLLDAEGDGEDDVAFLPGLFVLFVCLFVCCVVCF